MELKSTRPFPRNSGHFEDGAHIGWLQRWLTVLHLSLLRWLVGVARSLRGRMWPPVRGHGRFDAWGGKWHPCWWQLLDLLLWHSYCCCLVCASPLGLSGTGEMGLSSCPSLCHRGFKGCDRACTSLSHMGFLQVTALRPGCVGLGGGKVLVAQAIKGVRGF